jgi:hypothetical protein
MSQLEERLASQLAKLLTHRSVPGVSSNEERDGSTSAREDDTNTMETLSKTILLLSLSLSAIANQSLLKVHIDLHHNNY